MAVRSYCVEYGNNQSRIGDYFVDFMYVHIPVGDTIYILYAEVDPRKLKDEHGNPAITKKGYWNINKVPYAQSMSFPYLKNAMINMAESAGATQDILSFGSFSSDYIDPCVEVYTECECIEPFKEDSE